MAPQIVAHGGGLVTLAPGGDYLGQRARASDGVIDTACFMGAWTS